MIAVTRRQRDVLNFIEEFMTRRKYAPSYQEIADGLNLRSLATVHKHIYGLKKRGALKNSPRLSRTVEITDEGVYSIDSRFEMEGDLLWDNLLKCYWMRARKDLA